MILVKCRNHMVYSQMIFYVYFHCAIDCYVSMLPCCHVSGYESVLWCVYSTLCGTRLKIKLFDMLMLLLKCEQTREKNKLIQTFIELTHMYASLIVITISIIILDVQHRISVQLKMNDGWITQTSTVKVKRAEHIISISNVTNSH